MSTENVELLPGDLRVGDGGALIRLWGAEAEHYTQGLQLATVVSKLHALYDPSQFGEIYPCYLMLFSNDSRMYVVPSNCLLHPDHAKDPSRLFGTAHCRLAE